MVIVQTIIALLNQRKTRVLRIAEAALPEAQFRAFRGLVLDELGRDGFEKDLERLMAEHRKTTERAGQYAQGKEVPMGERTRPPSHD
jgi:hypothetical protein